MAQTQLTTDRLILRRWRAGDLAPYANICGDPDVMKFIARGAVIAPKQTGEEIQKMEATWQARGFGTFAVESREAGDLLGSVGFSWHDFLPIVSPCFEIGWRLAKGTWNKGYATEAAQAALDHGFESLGLSQVHCFCQTENLASQRIAAKIGMDPVDRVISPTYQREIIIYRTPA